MKRVFLIVLDSVGIGYEPDADKFGDVGANTLKSISKSDKFYIPNLERLGLPFVDGVDYLEKGSSFAGAVARLQELSNGKDTTTGHWEIAGIVSKTAMPTFKNGFPPEVIEKFETAIGRKIICNKVYSGTEVIKDYGAEHIKTGCPIVYTSADSVFQIAAHEDVIPTQKLYEYCKIAREILCGEYAVGRVIARPFCGEYPFERTKKRHDFSLLPPKDTMLDKLKANGFDCISVGKIKDIFASKGITDYKFTHDNNEGMSAVDEFVKKDFNGLCFVNLVDFDMLYGHRNNIDGYANALSEFDEWLGGFLKKLLPSDVLMITADHGCDPGYPTTDHTREYVPLIIYGDKIKPVNLKTKKSFSTIGATICDMFGVPFETVGKSILQEIIK